MSIYQEPEGEDARDGELVSHAQVQAPYDQVWWKPCHDVQANSESGHCDYGRLETEAMESVLHRNFLVMIQGPTV